MNKLFRFVPLFVIVLIVYNAVILVKPEWMLEPELFDSSHMLRQAPLQSAVPPAEVVPPADSSTAPDGSAAPEAPAVPEAPEEFAAEYINLSARPILSVPMPSGGRWKPIAADALLLFAILILYLELYKTTRMGAAAKVEHFFSALVFLIFLAEFLFIKGCATSTFGLVMLLSLIDVVGGIAISRAIGRRKA